MQFLLLEGKMRTAFSLWQNIFIKSGFPIPHVDLMKETHTILQNTGRQRMSTGRVRFNSGYRFYNIRKGTFLFQKEMSPAVLIQIVFHMIQGVLFQTADLRL